MFSTKEFKNDLIYGFDRMRRLNENFKHCKYWDIGERKLCTRYFWKEFKTLRGAMFKRINHKRSALEYYNRHKRDYKKYYLKCKCKKEYPSSYLYHYKKLIKELKLI